MITSNYTVVSNKRSICVGISVYVLFLLRVVESGQAQSDWKDSWKKTIEAARSEGRVVIHGPPGAEPSFQQFEKNYPEIKLIYISGSGTLKVQRIMAERRAGKYLADLTTGGYGRSDAILMQAGVMDTLKRSLIL